MALNKTKLASDIQAAFDQAKQQATPDDAAKKLVGLLADAIEAYVKSGEVTGITVNVQNTTGTQTAPVKLT